jgi:tetratricopeptide (TPR) repeat protein
MAAINNDLAFVAMRAGDLVAARDAARQAVFGGEAIGRPHTVAQAYGMLARVAWQQGDVDLATFYLDEARLRYEALGARWGLATTVNALGEVRRLAGDLAGAEASYREAVERYEACGSGDAVFARMNLGITQAERGHFAAAEQQLRAVEKELERSGRSAMLGPVRVAILFPLASLERWQEFDWFLPQAEHALKSSGMVDLDLARLTRMTAETCDAMGEDSRGARLWALSLRQWQALGRPKEAAEARSALGR